MVALPGPDGDGYVSLNSTTVRLLRGEVLPNHAQAALHQRFRLGERAANVPYTLYGIIIVFRTLAAARDFGLAWAGKGGIRVWVILYGEAEGTRPGSELSDTRDDFLAEAFTPQEVVATEGG